MAYRAVFAAGIHSLKSDEDGILVGGCQYGLKVEQPLDVLLHDRFGFGFTSHAGGVVRISFGETGRVAGLDDQAFFFELVNEFGHG